MNELKELDGKIGKLLTLSPLKTAAFQASREERVLNSSTIGKTKYLSAFSECADANNKPVKPQIQERKLVYYSLKY